MTIPEMRDCVGRLYPGRWKEKVSAMKDAQVMAIFFRAFSNVPDGSPNKTIIEQYEHKNRNKTLIKNQKASEGTQITIWDILDERRCDGNSRTDTCNDR